MRRLEEGMTTKTQDSLIPWTKLSHKWIGCKYKETLNSTHCVVCQEPFDNHFHCKINDTKQNPHEYATLPQAMRS